MLKVEIEVELEIELELELPLEQFNFHVEAIDIYGFTAIETVAT